MSKARCDFCSKPFGLVRHRLFQYQFCTRRCRSLYQANWERQKSYWRWIFGVPRET
ncbi:unnamed protein product [Phaeothamnion confervicola]